MSLPISEPSSARTCRSGVRAALAGALSLLALSAPVPALAAAEEGTRAVQRFEVGENVFVRALAVSEKNNALWVGTSVGAMEIDLEKQDVKAVYTREQGLANEYVFAIGLGPEDDVWFGTNAGGTSVLKDGKWETFFPMHGLADYWVYAYAWEADGDVWIGTWDGANHYDPKTRTWTTFRDELINIWVYGLDIDKEGTVWFGTEGGVNAYRNGAWEAWTHDDGLGATNIEGLPPSENTGLGTRSRHDLSVYVAGNESFNPNYVFAAKVDNQDRGIWFGTWGGGLSLFDGKSVWKSFSTLDGLAGNIVYSLAQGPDGTLWAGTNRGISSFDGTTWTTYDQGLPASHVYAIQVAPDGAVWAGVRGAVVRLAPQ